MSKHNGGENIGEAGKSLFPSSVNPGSPSMRVLPPGTGWGAAVGHKLDPYNSPPHTLHSAVHINTLYTVFIMYTQYIAQHFHLIQSIAPPTYRMEFLHT